MLVIETRMKDARVGKIKGIEWINAPTGGRSGGW